MIAVKYLEFVILKTSQDLISSTAKNIPRLKENDKKTFVRKIYNKPIPSSSIYVTATKCEASWNTFWEKDGAGVHHFIVYKSHSAHCASR
jgi:hypothetical protein